MTFLAHLADRVLNRPLLITPDKAEVVLTVLGERIGVEGFDASRFVGDREKRDASGNWTVLPYRITPEGVAVITITGSLVNRGAWVGANSGLTSYEGIQHQLRSAAADGDVGAIMLDIQSPGGEAVGAFETAAVVREVATTKPVVAVVNGMAASAAYAIASGATEIVTTETGVSGSIGVVLVHADYSGKLAKEGIKPTLIFAGDHKVDGNPFEALPKGVREDLQAEVDSFYEKFLQTVAAGRGSRMTADMARATQARTKIGEAAVAAGLADRVGTFDSVLIELSRARPGRGSLNKPKGTVMSEKTGASAATDAGIPKAEHDDAVAKARAEGASTATSRIVAALGSDGVKGNAARMSAALDLAGKTSMAASEIAAFVVGNVAGASAPAVPTLSQRAAETNATITTDGATAPQAAKATFPSASTVYAERRKARASRSLNMN